MASASRRSNRDSPRPGRELTDPRAETPDRDETSALVERSELEGLVAHLQDRVHELEHAMFDQHHVDRALSIYGSPRTLEEMAQQVALSPRFRDLTPAEHRYVASVGLASGLNPEFHLHAWKAGGKLLVMPDYKALITMSRHRRIMLKERRLTPDEMRARGIPERDIEEGSIGFLVEGYELDLAVLAKQADLVYEPRRGYGWWAAKKDETRWNNGSKRVEPTGRRIANDVPYARDGEWVARKRAMRDLYNQFADLTVKFGRQVTIPGARPADDGDGWEFDTSSVVEGEFSVRTGDVEQASWLKNPANVKRAEAARDREGLTDAAINEALGVDDWRFSGISPEEFKIALEQLGSQRDLR